jgi:tetratricopeptide (TPR) repeat protein
MPIELTDYQISIARFRPSPLAQKLTFLRKAVFFTALAIVLIISLSPSGRAWRHFSWGIIYKFDYGYDAAISEFKKAIQLNPGFYQAHNQLGVAYRNKGRGMPAWDDQEELYNKAVEYHEKALAIHRGYETAHASLGYTYLCLGREGSAAKSFGQALRFNPFSGQAHLGFGWLYSNLNLFEESIKAYEKAIELDPQDAYAYSNLGDAYINQKDYDSAVQVLVKAITLDRNFAQPYNNLGEAYLHKQMVTEAIEALSKAVALNERNLRAWANLYVALKINNEKKRLKWVDEEISGIFENQGIIHQEIGAGFSRYARHQEAIEEYEEGIKTDPENRWLWHGLGNAYRDLGDYEKALFYYQKVIEKFPNFNAPKYESGRLLLMEGKRQEAFNYFKETTVNAYGHYVPLLLTLPEDDPLAPHIMEIIDKNKDGFSEFYGLLSWIYENQNDPRALGTYQKVLSLNPAYNKRYVYEGIGRLYQKQGNYEMAKQYYRKALEVDPGETYGYNQIAMIYMMQGENLKAIAEYQKALERKKDEYGYLWMGISWEKEGKVNKAVAVYEEGTRQLPEESQAIQFHLNFLKTLKKFHLCGIYIWARTIEAKLERLLASRGLTPLCDRVSHFAWGIYFSRPLLQWFFLGASILGLIAGILIISFIVWKQKKEREQKLEASREIKNFLSERFEKKTIFLKKDAWIPWIFILFICLLEVWLHSTSKSLLWQTLAWAGLILALGYDFNYGMMGQKMRKSAYESLVISCGENLRSILMSNEKILYVYAQVTGKNTGIYVITSYRLLCYPITALGKTVQEPWGECSLKEIDKIEQSLPFSYAFSFGLFKKMVFRLKDDDKLEFPWVPRLDAEEIIHGVARSSDIDTVRV